MLPWSVHARNVWLIVSQIVLVENRSQKMSNLKVRLSQLATKKVPALALVVVAMLGMVAGVLAASIVVTTVTPNTGEIGTLHTNIGGFTVTDTGLAVVANTNSTDGSGQSFSILSTAVSLNNPLTAGHWMDVVTFVNSPAAAGTHIVKLTFRNGTGPQGATTLVTVTSGTWTTTTGSTGTVTFYVDLGVTTITSPLTAYITVT